MANGTPYLDPERRRYRLGYNPAMRGRGYTPAYSQMVGNIDPLYSYYSNVNYFTPGEPRFVPPMEPIIGEEEPEPEPKVKYIVPKEKEREPREAPLGPPQYPVYGGGTVSGTFGSYKTPRSPYPQTRNMAPDTALGGGDFLPEGGMYGAGGQYYPYQVEGGRVTSGYAGWNEPIYQPYYYNWQRIYQPEQTYGLAMGPGAAEYNETLGNAEGWTSTYSPEYYHSGPGRYLRSWGGLEQARAMAQRGGATRAYQRGLGRQITSNLMNAFEGNLPNINVSGNTMRMAGGMGEWTPEQRRAFTRWWGRRRNLSAEQRFQDWPGPGLNEEQEGTGLDTANFMGALVNWRP